MKKKKLLMSLAGVLVCGLGVGFFKQAAMGVDPFQSFISGLDYLLPLSSGALYAIASLLLLIFAFRMERSLIGIATFLNLFGVGYIAQFTHQFLQIPLPDPSLAVRFLFLGAGIVGVCLGSSLYMTADLGVSAYDSVSIILSRKLKLKSFQYARVGCDLISVLLGAATFLLAGGELQALPTIAGIGTVITAFFMGPLIALFNEKVSKPLLGTE